MSSRRMSLSSPPKSKEGEGEALVGGRSLKLAEEIIVRAKTDSGGEIKQGTFQKNKGKKGRIKKKCGQECCWQAFHPWLFFRIFPPACILSL